MTFLTSSPVSNRPPHDKVHPAKYSHVGVMLYVERCQEVKVSFCDSVVSNEEDSERLTEDEPLADETKEAVRWTYYSSAVNHGNRGVMATGIFTTKLESVVMFPRGTLRRPGPIRCGTSVETSQKNAQVDSLTPMYSDGIVAWYYNNQKSYPHTGTTIKQKPVVQI